MIPGTVYLLAEGAHSLVLGRAKHCLVVEKPGTDGVADAIVFHVGAEAGGGMVPIELADGVAGAAAVDRTYPLSAQALGEPVGELTRHAMERVTRALVARSVSRHYPFGHPERDFVPGQSPVPVSGRVYGEAEIGSLMDATLDFWLTTGRFNDAFEKRFGEFLGMEHVLTTNSGSSANLLAVTALTSPKLGERALRPGDEIVTVAAGFPTTVNPIIQNGMVPVFCDVSPPTCNILPEELEKALSPKTRAVILAHTLGNPFDLGVVVDFCRKHDLWLVEDCCDALGAQYLDGDGNWQNVGTFGDIATFSFYPAHHITMGEGGAVATNSGKLKKLIESFRDWGRDCWCPPGCDNTCGCRYEWKLGELPRGYDHKYVYSHIGYNLKISDMQAAVALAQMDRLEGFIRTRRENFSVLTEGFDDMSDVFILPEATRNSAPSWFGYPLTLRPESGIDREALLRHLEKARIGTRLLFGGNLAKQPYMRDVKHRQVGDLAGTDVIMRRTFWIGVYPGLTRPMLEYVVNTVREFVRGSQGEGS